MSTYKKIEIVGTSSESFARAADDAVRKAAESVRNMQWLEVTELRGRIDDGKIAEYQVTLKIGLTVD